MSEVPPFLNPDRLLNCTWQAFERDIARLMMHRGFQEVRLVGGSGDHGGDVLAVNGGEVWVVQCKYTSHSPANRGSVQEVLRAAQFYRADVGVIATSRPPSGALLREVETINRNGGRLEVLTPRRLLAAAAALPTHAPSRRQLRPYQQDAFDHVREALVDTGRAQLVMATGLGKTVVLSEVVASLLGGGVVPGNRVLVLAHTRELIEQLHQSFWNQLPRGVATYHMAGGEAPELGFGITFATIQSVAARHESEVPQFGMVVVDEAHHIGASSFRQVLKAVSPSLTVGATATPWRGDGFDIDSLLGPAVFQMGIAEGLRRGYLAEVDYRLLADNIDWDQVSGLSRFGYSAQHLNKKLIIPQRDAEAARTIAEVIRTEGRKNAIVYSPSADHAREFAGQLRGVGLVAEVILGDLDNRARYARLSAFKAGKVEVITTVDLFNEGVDVPDVDLVVFMRATHSRRIFVQQLGRGLRTANNKDKVVVLDFVSDVRRVVDVLRLHRAAQDGDVERLGLGRHLVAFADQGAGDMLRNWILDQASLRERPADPTLEAPDLVFDYPDIHPRQD